MWMWWLICVDGSDCSESGNETDDVPSEKVPGSYADNAAAVVEEDVADDDTKEQQRANIQPSRQLMTVEDICYGMSSAVLVLFVISLYYRYSALICYYRCNYSAIFTTAQLYVLMF